MEDMPVIGVEEAEEDGVEDMSIFVFVFGEVCWGGGGRWSRGGVIEAGLREWAIGRRTMGWMPW